MAKTKWLDGYILFYQIHPDEPIEGKTIRKNASVKTFEKILSKLRGKR